LKEEALDRTTFGTTFENGYGHVGSQAAELVTGIERHRSVNNELERIWKR
jgi:hypothetical protein